MCESKRLLGRLHRTFAVLGEAEAEQDAIVLELSDLLASTTGRASEAFADGEFVRVRSTDVRAFGKVPLWYTRGVARVPPGRLGLTFEVFQQEEPAPLVEVPEVMPAAALPPEADELAGAWESDSHLEVTEPHVQAPDDTETEHTEPAPAMLPETLPPSAPLRLMTHLVCELWELPEAQHA